MWNYIDVDVIPYPYSQLGERLANFCQLFPMAEILLIVCNIVELFKQCSAFLARDWMFMFRVVFVNEHLIIWGWEMTRILTSHYR